MIASINLQNTAKVVTVIFVFVIGMILIFKYLFNAIPVTTEDASTDDGFTTAELTTTIPYITSIPVTTEDSAIDDVFTTAELTTTIQDITSIPVTTEDVTANTTIPATTEDGTTDDVFTTAKTTIPDITSISVTTEDVTTGTTIPATTEDGTTDDVFTTAELTTTIQDITSIPVTTEEVTTDTTVPVTTEDSTTDDVCTPAELTTQAPISQRIFYTRDTGSKDSYGDIYHYVIDDVDGPQLKGKFKMPYAAQLPGMTFNYDFSVVEVVGDYIYFDYRHNSNHYHMQIDGQFNEYNCSLYEADAYSNIVFSPNVGTLCIAGMNKKQSVYIITQKSDWSTVVNDDNKYLSNLQGSMDDNFGFTTNENSIYLAGGLRKTDVQFINFDGVADLTSAKEKKWTMLGNLKYIPGYDQTGLQFYNNKLFVIGAQMSGSDCDQLSDDDCDAIKNSIQSFDLSTNTTKIFGV